MDAINTTPCDPPESSTDQSTLPDNSNQWAISCKHHKITSLRIENNTVHIEVEKLVPRGVQVIKDFMTAYSKSDSGLHQFYYEYIEDNYDNLM
jgi:hypothetical protein